MAGRPRAAGFSPAWPKSSTVPERPAETAPIAAIRADRVAYPLTAACSRRLPGHKRLRPGRLQGPSPWLRYGVTCSTGGPDLDDLA